MHIVILTMKEIKCQLTSSISRRFNHILMGMRRSTSPTRISDSPMTLCRAYLSTANTWNWIILLSSWNGSILNKNRSLKTGSVECFCIYNKKKECCKLIMHKIQSNKPHQWCNGLRAHIECGRSWVRASIGSNQRI